MKKMLNILLCGVLVLSLTGCGKDKENLKDEKKEDNLKTVVCTDSMKEEGIEHTESIIYTFKDDVATKVKSTINMKYTNLSDEEKKQLKEYDFVKEMKEVYKNIKDFDVNKIKIDQKNISDSEVEISMEIDFKDYLALENLNENKYDLNDDFSFNNVYEKLIKEEEKENEITCKVN